MYQLSGRGIPKHKSEKEDVAGARETSVQHRNASTRKSPSTLGTAIGNSSEGVAGVSTLADLEVQKFFYHMPHYR